MGGNEAGKGVQVCRFGAFASNWGSGHGFVFVRKDGIAVDCNSLGFGVGGEHLCFTEFKDVFGPSQIRRFESVAEEILDVESIAS